uniref:Glyco_18 domain-containing protein n=1 Tax=Caenorhabditis tropicalis TaxID=1561998 RepID=A0A1I7TUS4_9PELO
MSAVYEDVRNSPPDYNFLSHPDPPNVPLVMLPVRKEIKQVAERQNRNQVIKRYACFLSTGFLLFVLAIFLALFLWSRFGGDEANSACQKRLVGYYRGYGERSITEKQIEKLTHLIFLGVQMRANGRIEFENNKGRELVWIDSISDFILEQQLDGVEIYYRWPETKEEKENFVFFIRELRYKFEMMEKTTGRHYIITMMTRWEDEALIDELINSVDFFNVQTDNFYAPSHSTNVTGPLSPLYSSNSNSIDSSMKKLICKTRKPTHFDVTLPFRGSYFKNIKHPSSNDALYRFVDLVKGTSQGAFVVWREMEQEGFDFKKAVWHEKSKTSYILDEIKGKLYTFDDPKSLKEKADYAVSKTLGGIALSQLEYDDNANTLLNAVSSVNLCSNIQEDEIKYNCDGIE